jgi:hypothetical protein
MKVTIRVRLTPFWRSSCTVNHDRADSPVLHRRTTEVAALAVWAMSVLLMIGFMSMSMFATLSPPPVQVTIDEEDPSQPSWVKWLTIAGS